jgi:hypothetical protein
VKDEFETDAGRINFFGMVVVLLVITVMGATALIKDIAASIRSVWHNVNVPESEPILPLIIVFLIWTLICMTILAVDRHGRSQS